MPTKLSSDIFELTDFTNQLAKKYMDDVGEDTLFMSTFGMLADVSANMLQNAVVVSGELSNEAIPTRAKFDRNVITHALSVGIKDINAKPATMKVTIYFPEEIAVQNMINDRLIIDKDIPIFFEDIEFHLDYDLLIYRTKLLDGSYVYSANYIIDRKNPISNITNPYLPPVGTIFLTKLQRFIGVMCTLTQVEYREIYNKILTDNMIENKTFTFDYDGQMAAFDLKVTDPNGDVRYLIPVYDGLYDQDIEDYCYYTFVDSNTIRIKFNKDVYEPVSNSEVVVRLYTTKGTDGNFTYKDNLLVSINTTLRYPYNSLYMMIMQRGTDGSINGENRSSVPMLQKKIPKEALARGSVTNATDLNNYFNQINTDYSCLKVFRKRDNQLERLYYTYNLIKDTKNNIVPTNTIDFKVPYRQLAGAGDTDPNESLVLVPGTKIWYEMNEHGVYEGFVDDGEPHPNAFSYMNPFSIKVNMNPLYASYYLDIIHAKQDVEFDYINPAVGIQFIVSEVRIDRNFFSDRNVYQIETTLLQNIREDFGLVIIDPDTGEVDVNKIKVFGLLYKTDKYDRPFRYAEAQICPEYIGKEGYQDSYVFKFEIETNNHMSDDNELTLTNIYEPTSGIMVEGAFKSTMYMQIAVFLNTDEYEKTRNGLDRWIPGLEDYTLPNVYKVKDGVPLFYNYTDTINSAIELEGGDWNSVFKVIRAPLIKYDYVNSEDRMSYLVKEIKTKLEFIDQCLEKLETTFGVDYKLFNTYGPSNIFYIREEELIDKVNLTMTFNLKLYSSSDKAIVEYIIKDIKNYMEQMDEIPDLHMPNLITQITNTYREQIVYFEFVDINGYGPGEQHIVKDETYETSSKVPEFLNINTRDDDSPDIIINLM